MKEFLKKIKNYISPENIEKESTEIVSPKYPLMGYSDVNSQKIHFENLIKSIDIIEEDSVLDVGSGFGDLYPYLKKYNYTGMDLNSIAVEKSKIRFPEANFLEMDLASIEDRYDWIICSNLFITAYPMDMIAYMSKCVSIMYEQCNKGMAFNMFSSFGDVQSGYYHYDPIDTFSRMVSQYKSVDLIHSYSRNSFIIKINKNGLD